MGDLYKRLFSGWCFCSNSAYHQNGRIIVAWNALSFHVNIIAMSAQRRENGWKCERSRVAASERCAERCGLSDLKSTGAYYTWNNKQEGEARVFSKLDRALCNDKWLEMLPTSEAWFMPEGLFDHSPILVRVHKEIVQGNKPFKYYQMWSKAPDFQRRVSDAWSTNVTGTAMFCVVQKLKLVKKEMKQLNKDGFANIQTADTQAHEKLLECQKKLMERNDLSIKQRRLHNTIYGIHDSSGVWRENERVNEAFIEYYKKLLGTAKEHETRISQEIMERGKFLTEEHQIAFWNRDSWHIVGNEVIQAVKEFFQNGKLLKEVNNTLITLVPKVKCPGHVTEYRPIACCNVIYKTITKVICNRLSKILPEIIAENQGAFIKGRFIAHNVLICQDMVKGYGRSKASPSASLRWT
ncbi:uncharacterized protein LOC130591882 [Beta vulgaris subsp. vulgaris]|uniref:uncharacterized protein LOC130591882 n=1 Tax=Beta vulgaris subsp. vulgaris TaxID=3555 RepID=UPI0025467A72|nr:uncharacterized protein LOC130591882 [Beta vulgaris subsp. vulgaris]